MPNTLKVVTLLRMWSKKWRFATLKLLLTLPASLGK